MMAVGFLIKFFLVVISADMRLVRSNILSKQRIFPGGKHKYNTRLAESPPAPRLTGYPARLDWPGLS